MQVILEHGLLLWNYMTLVERENPASSEQWLERPVGLSLWQTATGANWHLRGLGKRVQFLVFGLLCKLSVKLAVIKKKKEKKVVKEKLKRLYVFVSVFV